MGFPELLGKRLQSGVFPNSAELPLPLFYVVLKSKVTCFLRFPCSIPLPNLFWIFSSFSFCYPNPLQFWFTPPHYSVRTPAGRKPGRSVLRKCRKYTGLAPSVHLEGSLHSPAIVVGRTTVSPNFSCYSQSVPHIFYWISVATLRFSCSQVPSVFSLLFMYGHWQRQVLYFAWFLSHPIVI